LQGNKKNPGKKKKKENFPVFRHAKLAEIQGIWRKNVGGVENTMVLKSCKRVRVEGEKNWMSLARSVMGCEKTN